MKNVLITLVNPSHPGNVGAVARAMKNMSLQPLRLVKPQRPINAEGFARAAGADDILQQAEYFETLPAAIEDCQLVLGTSARVDVPDVIGMPMRSAAMLIQQASQAGQKIAILFGREHAGLTNEELALCHYHIYIPCNPRFSSLNLAAAVQIMCYELFLLTEQEGVQEKKYIDQYASQKEIEHLFAHASQTLKDLHFYDPSNPRRLFPKLRALFNRTHLLKSEVAILRGILTAIDACEKPVF